MTPTEKRSALGLAAIYAARMFGLFMILPVFMLYADQLDGYSPALAGIAIGIYGLTQAAFQIPFGIWSDRIGRKPVITVGLLLFATGGVIAALADHIVWVIVGRALQGTGAIAAVLMAMAADLTREEHRVKAMAIIGMGIGASFMLALVIGPLLADLAGLAGIFWATVVLAAVSLVLLHRAIPTPASSAFRRDVSPLGQQLGDVLKNTQLLRLDAGILILHFIMTCTFVALPLVLRDTLGFDDSQHFKVYFAVLLSSVVLMLPFVIAAEKFRHLKLVFAGAIAVLAISQALLPELAISTPWFMVALVVYFAAFNVLEALLPATVSRVVKLTAKGTAMGVYATSQFLGAFLGGVAGGWLLTHGDTGDVFFTCAAAASVWLLIAITMTAPAHLSSQLMHIGEINDLQAAEISRRLLAIEGVAEANVVAEDGVAYLKVDRRTLDTKTLEAFATIEG